MKLNGQTKLDIVPKDDLFSLKRKYKQASLGIKASRFKEFITNLQEANQLSYFRKILSPMDRKVQVSLNGSGPQTLLMFGSNNYLGYANDPYIKQRVTCHLNENGIGLAGPPILNGYSKHHVALEERLAALKRAESAMIFPSGFQTNLGLICGLIGEGDMLIYDQYSHASTIDGILMSDAISKQFRHNQIDQVTQLTNETECRGQKFIAVEGLYSMDGDICPLNRVLDLTSSSNSICIIDDSHGTGILGRNGEGAIGLFDGKEAEVVHMGTFSKSFAVNGGFIAGSKDLINYLRYHARSYMFSASLSNLTVAAVLAGLDLVDKEPWRRKRLDQLKNFALECFAPFQLVCQPASAIIAILIPHHLNIREVCMELHRMGFFVNAVEYPAVPKGQERLRISLMIHHQESDIARLADSLGQIFEKIPAL